MENYYEILGVSPSADDFVIKAAYKALVQRYHPDKFHSNAKDAADAETKMRQLNEAYQVLSDPAKRRDYDISFQQGTQNNQRNSQKNNDQTKRQEDWEIALSFYPDLIELETRLGKIDSSLIPEFRTILLANQQYEQRWHVANQLEQNYLEGYFGNDSKILAFASDLLLAGHREVAKELNRIVKVVGNSTTSEQIILQIEDKFFPNLKTQREEEGDRVRRASEKREKLRKRDNIYIWMFFVFIIISYILPYKYQSIILILIILTIIPFLIYRHNFLPNEHKLGSIGLIILMVLTFLFYWIMTSGVRLD